MGGYRGYKVKKGGKLWEGIGGMGERDGERERALVFI